MEYNYQKNKGMIEGQDWYGPSFYGNYSFLKNFRLIARFDKLSSNTPEGGNVGWNHSNDGQLFILGIEYSPVKGIRLTPNFQDWTPEDESLPSCASFFFNCEVCF